MPVVRAIMSTRLEGSVVVLTKSNDEALTVTGLLQKYDLPTRLIQSDNTFSLSKLAEMRCFMQLAGFFKEGSVIEENDWNMAKSGMLQNLGVWRNPRRPSYLL